MKILGIYREEIFSPGKVQEDKAIMDEALFELHKAGINTQAIPPDIISKEYKPGLVLNMAQSDRVLSILETWEDDGIRIINSVNSIRNCYRKNMIALLKNSGLPIPKSWIYTIEMIENELSGVYSSGWIGIYWLKRGDFHAIEPNDVIQVSSFEDMEKGLSYFRERGINEIVIQEHVEGEIVKFYGIGEEYIRAFKIPDLKRFDIDQSLKNLITEAVRCLGLEIYGGDMIIRPNNSAILVDINDWPSFSLCRDEAAREIAKYVKRLMEDFDELSTKN